MAPDHSTHWNRREAFLRRLYEDADERREVHAMKVAASLGLEPAPASDIVDDLVEEGLVVRLVEHGLVRLTIAGVDSVEGTTRPVGAVVNQTTNQLFAEKVEQVQFQPSHSSQHLSCGSVEDLRRVLEELRDALRSLELVDDDEGEFRHALEVAEQELNSEAPRRSVLERALRSMERLLRGTAEATAGAILAPEAEQALAKLTHALAHLPVPHP